MEMDLLLDGDTPDASAPRAAVWEEEKEVPDEAMKYWPAPSRAHLLQQGFEPFTTAE